MLEFTEREIAEQVEEILYQRVFTVQPVGNHYLKRHLVYKVTLESKETVIYKVYYKTDRRNREIATLRALTGSRVQSPALLRYGNLPDRTEWLLMSMLEGVPFEQVQASIPPADQLEIFRAMGEELGKLHSFAAYDFYGPWDEAGRPLGAKPPYAESIRRSLRLCAEEIQRQGLAERDLLLEAVRRLQGYIQLLADVREFRLIHRDFDGRNVLVEQRDGKWLVSGVIDFEGAAPGDPLIDVVNMYHRYFLEHVEAEAAFLVGYSRYCTVPKDFCRWLPVYLLREGVGICSWAYEQAMDYYLYGVALVKKVLPQVSPLRECE